MKSLTTTLAVATTLMSAAMAAAEEPSPAELLKAWGDDLVGKWVSKLELDSDLPGIGKEGDVLRGEVVWTAEDGVYRGTWTGSVNGKVVDSGIAVVGWDAQRNGIKVQWVTRAGASASNLIKRKGKRWIGNFVLTATDGTSSSHRGAVTVKNGTLTDKQTNRKQGDESLPDRTVTSVKQ